MTVNCPAVFIVTTPSQVHIQVEVLFSAGIFPSKTVGLPVIHGVPVAGIQGIGVKTPNAAAVAAITVGFVGALHIPNVAIFTKGLLSIIVAAGITPVVTLAVGNTIKGIEATPKEHLINAPAHTC